MRRIDERSLENAAVFYLRRFPSSAANLRRVLDKKVRRARAKGAEASEEDAARAIDVVAQRMIDAGLVDDGAYARGLAQSLFNRGLALRSISRRLHEKGVPEELARTALETLKEEHEDADRTAAAAFARRRRLGPHRALELRAERRERDMAALARAGFSYGIARAVIDAEDPP
jgi:regulatory protein